MLFICCHQFSQQLLLYVSHMKCLLLASRPSVIMNVLKVETIVFQGMYVQDNVSLNGRLSIWQEMQECHWRRLSFFWLLQFVSVLPMLLCTRPFAEYVLNCWFHDSKEDEWKQKENAPGRKESNEELGNFLVLLLDILCSHIYRVVESSYFSL